jgi:hypothetical protein
MVKSRTGREILLAALLAGSFCAPACTQTENTANTSVQAEQSSVDQKSSVDEKPFVAGGSIEMRLDGGSYEVRPASGNVVRVTLSGNTGNARTELTTSETHANLTVKDTPHSNFRATIEVPKTADLVIRLSGGNLVLAEIVGNKDVESNGGNVEIAVGDANQYSSVDASVKAGDIHATMFGGSKSGLLPHVTWSGPGRHTLRVNLGAGNLSFRDK